MRKYWRHFLAVVRWLVCRIAWSAIKARQYPRLVAIERADGEAAPPPATGRRYAIVALRAARWNQDGLLALMAALRRNGVTVIVMVNGFLAAADRESLAAMADHVVIRPDFGRDFGPYRAGSLLLQRSGAAPERVLYFNDSLVYLDDDHLDDMVAALATSDLPVLGATQSFSRRHHLGSFALSLSGEAFRNSRVLEFWRRYRGFNLRPHAILKGEIALSRLLTRCGYPLAALYTVEGAATRLRGKDADGLWNAFSWLSGAARAAFLDRWASFRETPPPDELVRQTAIDHLFHTDNLSQAHFYCGLFHRVLGMPIIKKDLLYRGILDEKEMAAILDDRPPEEVRGVVAALNQRGREAELNPAVLFVRRLLMLD